MVPALPGMEREACVTLALKQDDRKDDALDRTWGPSEIVTADRRPACSSTRSCPRTISRGHRYPAARGIGSARCETAISPPGRGSRSRACGSERCRGDANRVWKDPLLQLTGSQHHPFGAHRSCALTKALAQDQLAELHGLRDSLRTRGEDIGAHTYDGDTLQDARRAIRGRAQLVLSNPEMLHSVIFPHHPKWAKLFENLRYVVIDELHAYRGVFGSHVANIMRRLGRVCSHYGSSPLFIC